MHGCDWVHVGKGQAWGGRGNAAEGQGGARTVVVQPEFVQEARTPKAGAQDFRFQEQFHVTRTCGDVHSEMFTAASFTAGKGWKQLLSPRRRLFR